MLKDREVSEDSPCSTPDECAGCGGRIHDRYYLLAVDRQWHASCLRCCDCKLPLEGELTCFARDGNIYCKEDYYRLFCVKRCARCGAGISASELVMRARDLVYHVACFTCAACSAPLNKGDTFGVRDGLIYCRAHYEATFSTEPFCDDDVNAMFSCYDIHRGGSSPNRIYQTVTPAQKGRPRKRKIQPPSPEDLQIQTMRMSNTSLEIMHTSDLSSSLESLTYENSVGSPGSVSGHHSQRTKRMRTSFKHHQLRTMKSYFAINQNPDAKDLKQLAQKTGLSKRVLQVWFQNARAKWRRNIMRQESGQSPGVAGIIGGSGVGGMVSSPGMMGDGMTHLTHHHLEDLQRNLHSNHSVMGFTDLY